MKAPPFTKQELADYVKERGYTADIDSWYLWYEKTEFHYVQGKLRIPLKNWRADVNLKLKTGKFSAKPIPKPKPLPEPRPSITPATDEQKAEIKAKMKQIGKRPDYGFRSNRVLEQKRQQAVKKLEDG